MSTEREEPTLYELLLELDLLEELREDLEERGLRTLDEVIARIEAVSRQIDQLEPEEAPETESR